jgi:hypothetical protein
MRIILPLFVILIFTSCSTIPKRLIEEDKTIIISADSLKKVLQTDLYRRGELINKQGQKIVVIREPKINNDTLYFITTQDSIQENYSYYNNHAMYPPDQPHLSGDNVSA